MNVSGHYSKKLAAKIQSPRYVGLFSEQEARPGVMRLVTGSAGKQEEGRRVVLYWLVDENDGVIADVKFQVFGPPALIGAAETACELLLRKNYDQARRLSVELIDKQVRDRKEEPAFPREVSLCLHLVLTAIQEAAAQCFDIPIAEAYTAPPLDREAFTEGETYPGWEQLDHAQKIAVIEEVIDREIRPYIELDAGGVQVLDLREDREVIIAYQGACTTCHSATGATLSAIQQLLQTRIHPDLRVTPR